MSDDDFFDKPARKKPVLSSADIGELNALMVTLAKEQATPDAAHARYVERLQALLAAQGTDLQAALRATPDFSYVKAGGDKEAFSLMLAQAAAASAGAAAAVDAKSWEPPPADEVPEDEAEDYA